MSKKTVAVIFGGASSEYEVSLTSADFVISGINRDKFDLVLLGITKDGRWFCYEGPVENIKKNKWENPSHIVPAVLSPDRSTHGFLKIQDGVAQTVRVDVVFPVLHGKNGEDGTIQGLLDLAGIPYVGAGVLSSAVCMDKEIANTLLDAAGIPRGGWSAVRPWDLDDFDLLEPQLAGQLGYPMFVKPANAGSSVGVSKAADKESLRRAIELALLHDKKAIVEEYIDGREVECAVMGNRELKASVLGEIKPQAEFYDYDAKYNDDTTEYYIPARLDEENASLVQELAKAAYEALQCEGLARVDFFIRDGEILLSEINTMPGFTAISMFPRLFMSGGMSPQELAESLILLALEK